MSDITSMLSSFWRIFTDLRVPLLNISFATLWLGVFGVSISMRILMPLVGLGGKLPKMKHRGSRSGSPAAEAINRDFHH